MPLSHGPWFFMVSHPKSGVPWDFIGHAWPKDSSVNHHLLMKEHFGKGHMTFYPSFKGLKVQYCMCCTWKLTLIIWMNKMVHLKHLDVSFEFGCFSIQVYAASISLQKHWSYQANFWIYNMIQMTKKLSQRKQDW